MDAKFARDTTSFVGAYVGARGGGCWDCWECLGDVGEVPGAGEGVEGVPRIADEEDIGVF